MSAEANIYEVAAEVLRNAGGRAVITCAELAEEWEKVGDPETAAHWRQVLEAVTDLSERKSH